MARKKSEDVFELARMLREADIHRSASNSIHAPQPESKYIELAARLVELDREAPAAGSPKRLPKGYAELRRQVMLETFGKKGPQGPEKMQLQQFREALAKKHPTLRCSRATFFKDRKAVYSDR